MSDKNDPTAAAGGGREGTCSDCGRDCGRLTRHDCLRDGYSQWIATVPPSPGAGREELDDGYCKYGYCDCGMPYGLMCERCAIPDKPPSSLLAVRGWLDKRKTTLQREMNDGEYSDQLALIAHLEKFMNELEKKDE